MSLPAGTRIGPYEVLSLAGSGGMGEVYRARDTRLGRDVALKVLPEALASEPERLARFRREAHVIAALNHPNVAQVYDFEETSSAHALAMELVEGPTLAEVIDRLWAGVPAGSRRIPAGLSLGDMLQIARQLTLALEAAHEHGIVHRDLKPANIIVREDGTVKVLDFGIAKAFVPDTATAPVGADITPTITALTALGAGVVIGTPAYMAPEQVRGRRVDQRADIWAFGCVLFELLSGTRVFEGEDMSTTFSNVLRNEPDFSELPAEVPRHVRETLRFCLQKDVKQRLADVRDVRLALDGALTPSDAAAVAPPVPVDDDGLSPRPVWCWQVRPARPRSRCSRRHPRESHFTSTSPAPKTPISTVRDGATSPSRPTAATSATRRPAAFTSAPWIRPTPTRWPASKAWSPIPCSRADGRILVYVQGNQLRKIPITGGESVLLASVNSPSGVSWTDEDQIVFAQADGVWRVAADGGPPQRIAEPNEGERLTLPQVLPGGKWLLVSSRQGATSQVVALSLQTKERRLLIDRAVHARYVGTGHLLYLSAGRRPARDRLRSRPSRNPRRRHAGDWHDRSRDNGRRAVQPVVGRVAHLRPRSRPGIPRARLGEPRRRRSRQVGCR